MAGIAALGSFLNVGFDRLTSAEVVNWIRGKKLDPKLIAKLKTNLPAARDFLDNAEKKQIRDPGVKNLLNDLKDAVYVAKDLLDEISTKDVTQKEGVSYNLFSRLFNLQDREMVTKLEDIVERLEYVLRLKEIPGENLSYKSPSTSLQDGSHVYGRGEDKEAIIKLLLDDNGDGVAVIPIVAMGGVGKTTLAQLVYNDDRLKNFLKAWVCLSDIKEFDILKATKIITEAVTESTCEKNDLNSLHQVLQDRLKEKKFLIFLDDVWIENYDNWKDLKKPFQCGVRGSKILVTTRSQKVASVVRTVQTYNLNQLSSEDCWLVFADHACFSSGSCGNTADLETIGREIGKKCAGLALVAQSFGGILRRNHDIRDWKNLLESNIWELSESESKIVPALQVSYHYLPPHLKPCFVYCSLYPKGYEFEKEDLILLWMAEDLLPLPRKGKTLEEVGGEYLDYLVARSFLQCSSDPWEESFVVHDLLHDLATFLGGEFYYRSEDPGVEAKISIKTRHLSFTKFSGLPEMIEVLRTAKFLRTFLPMRSAFDQFNDDGKAACIVMSMLKHLRVLSFCRFRALDALPDSIGELIHLRYLDLEGTSIMALPESLGNLYNLQTLKLSGCDKLTVLPSSMQNLVNLLYLDICGTALKEMPQRMGELTQLQHLSHYIVGKHEENGIKELGGLPNLHGSLSIEKLENVRNGIEASKAKIVDKYISQLLLTWSSANCFNSQTDTDIRDILCNLQPHQDLQLLVIDGYRGTRFPDWVGNSSYHNMTDIKLSSCKHCRMLPSFGQLPSLKNLTISYLDALETIDDSFYNNTSSLLTLTPLPLLESLIVSHCDKLKSLPQQMNTLLPKLGYLYIKNCPKIESFPTGGMPPSLRSIYIANCEKLLSDSAWPSMDMLTTVSIEGPCDGIKSFPKEGLLPSSLICLELFSFSSLEMLDCKGLLHLTSLQKLTIESCPKLENLAGERLPTSLTELYISACLLLKEQCCLKHPQVWPKISHVNVIKVDGRPIS